MPLRLIYDRRAAADVRRAFAWYHRRSHFAAQKFLDSLADSERRIQYQPVAFARYDPWHRFAKLKKYPYLVLFREPSDPLLVVAVGHSGRSGRYWRTRTKSSP